VNSSPPATWRAYVNSLFGPEIIRDLRLRDYGFEVVERNPASFSPFADGRCLLLGGDAAANLAEIAKFSARDAIAYPKYEAMLERVASVLEPLLDAWPDGRIKAYVDAGELLAAVPVAVLVADSPAARAQTG
jgi:phytoene dehydrogenase-like protein